MNKLRTPVMPAKAGIQKTIEGLDASLRWHDNIPGQKLLKIFLFSTICLGIVSCGFKLRGYFDIPKIFQVLRICPDAPFDPFQRVLRKTLHANCVNIIDIDPCDTPKVSTLTILESAFTERTLAYGSDVQINRVSLQFKVRFQVCDPEGKILIQDGRVEVARELTIIPNAILGTENERLRVQSDLYMDATTQIITQLTLSHAHTSE